MITSLFLLTGIINRRPALDAGSSHTLSGKRLYLDERVPGPRVKHGATIKRDRDEQ